MNKLQISLHKEISGKELNELLGYDYNYLIKFMYDNDVHFGMEFRTGLNIDKIPFNPNDECSAGGVYFCHITDYYHWYNCFGKYVRRVIVPSDARVYVEEGKIKADRVILSDREIKDVLLRKLLTNYCQDRPEPSLEIVKQHGFTIQFIDQSLWTNRMLLEAVKQNGFAIRFIGQRFRTNKMMLNAVKQNGWSIEFIKQKFRTTKMIAVATSNQYVTK